MLLFTRRNCHKCEEIKDLLADKNIPYQLCEVNTDWDAKRLFMHNNFTYVPSIVAYDDNTDELIKIERVTEESLNELLERLK